MPCADQQCILTHYYILLQCQSDGHSLRCYKAEGVVDPQQCPVNFTSCACSNETRSRRDVDSSDVAAVAPTEDDSCQCASDNKSVAPCEACSASATAVVSVPFICCYVLCGKNFHSSEHFNVAAVSSYCCLLAVSVSAT